MLFNSVQFIVFFPVVVIAFYVMPKRFRLYWLLLASYYFYMNWNAKYAILLGISTVITFLSGILLSKIPKDKANRLFRLIILFICVAANIGILTLFKYGNFIIEVLNFALQKIGISIIDKRFDFLLPVGISFYTFQALGYVIDVYRGDIEPCKHFFKYALFVSFFPQLVAGPIERSNNLLSQLNDLQGKKFDFYKTRDGFYLMLWGYFLKIVIADRIAVFVDKVYGEYHTYHGWYILIATILFAVQIYCDFAGYSIIAKGAAEILGIRLMDNFSAPYLSTSVSDFWRKWHISLTSWFKDYLYIPLGGGRRGKIRKYLNKFVVFLVSGLWHGANFSFIIWGGCNGLYQILGEVFLPIRKKISTILHLNPNSLSNRIVKGLVTFALVDFSWIFFRANGYHEAIDIIGNMVAYNNFEIVLDGSLYKCGLDKNNFYLMFISIMVLLLSDIANKQGIIIRDIIFRQDYWCRCLVSIFIICFILIFGVWGSGYDVGGFIYFQF